LILTDPISILKGVGEQRSDSFSQSGIDSIRDLLYTFPRRYLDRTNVTPIKHFQKNQTISLVARVESFGERPIRRGKLFQAIVTDGTGFLTLSWFNSIHFIRRKLKVGLNLAIHGKVEWYRGYSITHPEVDFLESEEGNFQSGKIIPLYPLNQDLKSTGIEQRFLRKIIQQVLDSPVLIEDYLSKSFLKKNNLVSLEEALKNIHFSTNKKKLNDAIRRLKFDEHYLLQILLVFKKEKFRTNKTKPLKDIGPYFGTVIDNLKFELTNAQKNVVKDIHFDLKKDSQMNRLIQGDVGCGKTIVAILISAIAIGNNVQVAIMAPTEILARQHYFSFKTELEKNNIACGLLIGKMKKNDRNLILKGLSNGKLPIIIGTHALIQQDVKFKQLGLVIVDEQHRFGVKQRAILIQKGKNPHSLSMTATPIPRTLSITYHGDMDLSLINELPSNRIPVRTKVVLPQRMQSIYDFIKKECFEGRQCMIVFPLIDESEKSDLEAAIQAHIKLKNNVFSDLEVGLVHGKMTSEEKENVITEFAKKRINILVSTTVIEVGIDIPNATVMLIENAERFGLTQLHQLRGRVGRGAHQSYCILVRRNITDTSIKRLKVLEETNDGFKVADEDLRLRGPGEFFGLKQSGFLKFKIANLVTDDKIIQLARETAINIIKKDPLLISKNNKIIKQMLLETYSSKLNNLNS
jgi:ATP-dependent DNA helicase RecG